MIIAPRTHPPIPILWSRAIRVYCHSIDRRPFSSLMNLLCSKRRLSATLSAPGATPLNSSKLSRRLSLKQESEFHLPLVLFVHSSDGRHRKENDIIITRSFHHESPFKFITRDSPRSLSNMSHVSDWRIIRSGFVPSGTCTVCFYGKYKKEARFTPCATYFETSILPLSVQHRLTPPFPSTPQRDLLRALPLSLCC